MGLSNKSAITVGMGANFCTICPVWVPLTDVSQIDVTKYLHRNPRIAGYVPTAGVSSGGYFANFNVVSETTEVACQGRLETGIASASCEEGQAEYHSVSTAWEGKVSEPAGSPVVASLARRLRELRLSRFPDARLTQGEVAKALSEEEPVAISTLSAWENVRAPTLPSRTRLSTYARFFATERSLDRTPHLVPLADLDPDELQGYKKLERELFRLRDADAGEIPEPRRSWRFEDRASVTVICADLDKSEQTKLAPYTDLNNPNYTELFTYANLDALVALLNHLHSENPNATIRFCRASEATSEDLSNHLVLLGGIAWNDVTHRLNDSVGLPVRQVANAECRSGRVFELQCGPDQGKQYIPRWRDDDPGTAERPGVLLEGVAMLARLPNPFNVLRTLTYCNGVHSRGVLGAVRCLTDPAVREINELYLEETFANSDRFLVLMRVPLVGNRTITPSLSNPDTVLFGWPKNPAQE
jgi:hypothetical protein